MKPWLVGENNPYGPDPYFALYPEPDGCAGWRLCHLVLQVQPAEYLRRFERRNLLSRPRWSAPLARQAAAAILRASAGAPLVLLGRKVQEAFGITVGAFSQVLIPIAGEPGPRVVVVLPHPSGLCRAWNEPGAFARARVLVRGLL